MRRSLASRRSLRSYRQALHRRKFFEPLETRDMLVASVYFYSPSSDGWSTETPTDNGSLLLVASGYAANSTINVTIQADLLTAGNASSGDFNIVANGATFAPPAGTFNVVLNSANGYTQSIGIIPVNDDLVESYESAVLTIIDPSTVNNYNLYTDYWYYYSTIGVGISDNDFVPNVTPTVNVNATIASADEGASLANSIKYTFTRDYTSSPLTVSYSLGGTATYGVGNDYAYQTLPSPIHTVYFAAGASQAEVIFRPLADDVYEGAAETVKVTIDDSKYYAVGTRTAEATINDTTAPPAVSISGWSGLEGSSTGSTTTATFNVSLNRLSNVPVTMTYSTKNGTAVASGDYQVVSTTNLTIPAGSMSVPVTVKVNQDTTREAIEDFYVDIAPGSLQNAVAGTLSAKGTIINDDIPYVYINAILGATEGGATGTVRISRDMADSYDLPVALSLSNTAIHLTDYTLAPELAKFIIPATKQYADFTVTAFDDGFYEGTENATFTLKSQSPNPQYKLYGGSFDVATIAITDNEAIPSISITDWSGYEVGKASFQVNLSPPSSKTVTVQYKTSNATATGGTASPSDYKSQATAVTLTFVPGDTQELVEVDIFPDTTDELDETFNVDLSIASNANIVDSKGVGTILDNDGPSLIVSNPTVMEGGQLSYQVSLSAASVQAVSVNYLTTAAGTATPSNLYETWDYTTKSGTLNFPANSTSPLTVVVQTNDDTANEISETVQLQAQSVANNQTAYGTGTITDNDPAPTVSISDAVAWEPNTFVTLTVTLSQVSGRDVTVKFQTKQTGSATAGADYYTFSDYVTIPAGKPSAQFNLSIINDTLEEFTETFQVLIDNPVNATVYDDTAVVSITSEDEYTDLKLVNYSGNGQSWNVKYQVLELAANPFYIRYYRSSDGVSLDVPVGVSYLNTASDLQPGEHEFTFLPTFTDVPEDYFLVARIDDTFANNEGSDENNNTRVFDGGMFRITENTKTGPVEVIHYQGTSQRDEVRTEVVGDNNVITYAAALPAVQSGTSFVDVDGDSRATQTDREIITYRMAHTGDTPWQNKTNRFDVNNDGYVTTFDVLNVINAMNLAGGGFRPAPTHVNFWDVSGDHYVSVLDAHQVLGAMDKYYSGYSVWTNLTNPLDVDGDKAVTTADSEAIRDYLKSNGAGAELPLAGSTYEFHIRTHVNYDDVDVSASNANAKVWVFGGPGNDQLQTGGVQDLLYGGDGNDYLHGRAGVDSLYGELGDDTLRGGLGRDIIDGGPGNNTIIDEPEAVDDAYTLNEDITLSVPAAFTGLLTNDSVDVGQTVTAKLGVNVQHGKLTLNADGSFVYDPDDEYNGTDSFTYTAVVNSTSSSPAKVTLTINPVNDKPVAIVDTYAAIEDTTLTVVAPGVLANDTDIEGNPLTAVLSQGPANGTLTLNSNGSFTYKGKNNYSGPDSFSYYAKDATPGTPVQVSISVSGVNDPPTITQPANISILEDKTGSASFTVSDPEDSASSLTVTASSDNLTLLPLTGIAIQGTGAARTLVVTPAAEQSGSATVTLTVTDTAGAIASKSIYVSVSYVNDAPTIEPIDDQSGIEDVVLAAIPLTLWDDDPVYSPSTSAVSSNPAVVLSSGIVVIGTGPDREIQITPVANASGTTTITITANDGLGTSSESFNVTFAPQNDPPSFTLSQDIEIIANAGLQTRTYFATSISPGPADESSQSVAFEVEELDGDLTFATAPSIDASGTLTFEVESDEVGSATFSVIAFDSGATIDNESEPQTFTITVHPRRYVWITPDSTSDVNELADEASYPEFIVQWTETPYYSYSRSVIVNLSGDATAKNFGAFPADYVLEKFDASSGWAPVALTGEDLQVVAGSESEVRLRVKPINDPIREFLEYANLQIVGNEDFEVDVSQAEVQAFIHDNDHWYVSLTGNPDNLLEPETSTTANFTLVRSGETDLTWPLRVRLAIGGSADLNSDYKVFVGDSEGYLEADSQSGEYWVTIPPQETSLLLRVQSLNDSAEGENFEDIQISVQSYPGTGYASDGEDDYSGAEVGGYEVGSPSTGTVGIYDEDGAAKVRIEALSANASEDGNTATVRVTRSGVSGGTAPIGKDLSVLLALDPFSDVEAGDQTVIIDGVEYALGFAGTTSVVIPAGQSSIEFEIKAVDDQIFDPSPEAGTIVLVDPLDASYVIDEMQNSAGFSIEDNDRWEVSVVAIDALADEQGKDPAVFRFTRLNATDQSYPLQVYFTFGGSATAAGPGQDFTVAGAQQDVAGNWSITFAANQLTTDITLTPIDDWEFEGQAPPLGLETVTVTVTDNSLPDDVVGGYIADPNVAHGVIIDNDGFEVSISAADGTIAESIWGAAAYNLPLMTNITVSRAPAQGMFMPDINRPLDVYLDFDPANFPIMPLATHLQDYLAMNVVPVNGPRFYKVTIPAGALQTQFTFNSINDRLYEQEERAWIEIVQRPNDYLPGLFPHTHVDIRDDDQWELAVIANDPVGSENGDAAQFQVIRGGAFGKDLSFPLPFDIHQLFGLAVDGVDYNPAGNLTIPAGSWDTFLTINPIDDPEQEPVEDVLLLLKPHPGDPNDPGNVLNQPDAYTLSPFALAQAFILDNDTWNVSITSLDHAFEQNTKPGKFKVTRSGQDDKSHPLLVRYQVTGGTATIGVDYVAPPGIVEIPAEEFEATFELVPMDDQVIDPGETVTISLLQDDNWPDGYYWPQGGDATIEIKDNEFSVSVEAIRDAHEDKVNGKFRLKLAENQAADHDLEVVFSLAGTATLGADYTIANAVQEAGGLWRATIPQGQVLTTIEVVPETDEEFDPNETVVLAITTDAASSYTVGTPATDSLLIEDPLSRLFDWLIKGCKTGNCFPYNLPVNDAIDAANGVLNAIVNAGPVQAAAGIANILYTSFLNPHPIISHDVQFSKESLGATVIEAQLTYGGIESDPVYYSPSGLTVGQNYRFSLQVDATTLPSGQYDWTLAITEHYGDTNDPGHTAITRNYRGETGLNNLSESAQGNRWHQSLTDYLVFGDSSISVVEGNGNVFTFKEDPLRGYVRENGEFGFSTLDEVAGGYILIDREGTARHFNSTGQLMERVDRNQNVTTYLYTDGDNDGFENDIASTTDSAGRTTTFEYVDNKLSAVIDYAARVTNYHYVGSLLTSIEQPYADGANPNVRATTTMNYDPLTHQMTSMTLPDGTTTTYVYDSHLLIKQRIDADGTVTNVTPQLAYGLVDLGAGSGSISNPAPLMVFGLGEGIVTTTLNGQSRTESTKYDAFGLPTKVTDALGQVTLMERDSNGLVTELVQPSADASGSYHTTYTYDDRGNLLTMTLPNGGTRTWTYGNFSQVSSYIDEVGAHTIFDLDSRGNVLKMRRVVGSIDPVGSLGDDVVTTFTYTPLSSNPAAPPAGLIESTTDALGRETEFEYDSRGRLTTVFFAVGTLAAATYRYEYNSNDDLVATIDELNRRTEREYDLLGRLKTLLKPTFLGGPTGSREITYFAYDTMNRLTQITDGLGRVTDYVVNVPTRTQTVIAPDHDGNSLPTITTTTFGINGTPLTVTDPLGRVTSLTHDPLDRLTTIVQPAVNGTSSERHVTYDALGRTLTDTDARGGVTSYLYEDFGKRVRITMPDPDGSGQLAAPEVSYEYDDAGRLIKNTNALGLTTEYEYDDLSRLKKILEPLGRVTEYFYDKVGNVVSTKDGRGAITSFSYDARNRLTKRTDPDPDGAGPLLAPETEYQYDAAGQLVSVTDPLDRVTVFEYDGAGRLIRTIEPDPDLEGPRVSPVTEYSYDAIGRLVQMLEPAGATGLVPMTQYVYDALDNLITILPPNLAGNGVLSSAAIHLTYDAVGQLLTRADGLGRSTSYQYDELGRVSKIILPDPDGPEDPLTSPETNFTYDLEGNLTSSTDALGNVTTYVYDSLQRLRQIIEADPDDWGVLAAPITQYGYDAAGQLTSVLDPLGRQTRLEYDALGRQTKVSRAPDTVSPAIQTTQFAFDFNDNLTKITDSLGFETDFEYDLLNRLAATLLPDADGSGPLARGQLSYFYDAAGQLTKSVDELGYFSLLAYDRLGNVVSETLKDPDGSAGPLVAPNYSYNYDGRGNLLAMVDPLGNQTDYAYDNWSQLISVLEPDPDYEYGINRPLTTYAYDFAGQLTSVTDPLEQTTSYVYDRLGRLITKSLPDPDGPASLSAPVLQTTYDAVGNVLTETDLLGPIAAYQYDRLNRLTKISLPDPDVEGPLAVPETLYNYDAAGQITAVTDSLGRQTQYQYDALGRTIVETLPDPDGAGPQAAPVWTTVYDSVGNVLQAIDPYSRASIYAYDGLQRVTSATLADPDGEGPLASPVWLYGYDAAGQMLTATDPLTRTTGYEYDGLGRQITVTLPDPDAAGPELAPAYRTEYDAANNVVREIDPLLNATDYTYDRLHRLKSVLLADPDGTGSQDRPLTTYDYDRVGQLLSVTDPLARTTTFAYDHLGRHVKTTLPDPDFVQPLTAPVYEFNYDSRGNQTAFKDALGNVTNFQYDTLSRLTAIIQPDPETGDPLSMNRPTRHFAYDLMGQLLTETDQLGRVTQREYDLLGRQVKVTLPDPDGYDPTLASPVFEYEYDLLNNQVAARDALNNVTNFQYDALSRLTLVVQPDPNSQDPNSPNRPTTSYAYDVASQLMSTTDPLGRTTSFEYDLLGRRTAANLPQVTEGTPRYETRYDRVGNVVASVGPLGQTTQYGYDNLYRLTAITQNDPDGTGSLAAPTTSFEYDAASQLLAQVDPIGRRIEWEYDLLGRRIKQYEPDPDGPGSLSRMITTVAYDAMGNTQSITDPLNQVTTFAYDHLHRRISRTDASNGVTSFAYDVVGNLLSLTDPEANTTTWQYDNLDRTVLETNELDKSRSFGYDAMGNLTRRTDRNGRVTEYSYDNLYRSTAEDWKDGSGATIRTLNFSYDAAGQLTAVSDPAAAYTYSLDALGRVSNEGQTYAALGKQVQFAHQYDLAGNRLQVTASIDGITDFVNQYQYDLLNRPTQITQAGASGGHAVAEKRIDLSYIADGRFDSIRRYEDLAGTEQVLNTSYEYDYAGQLKQITHSEFALTPVPNDFPTGTLAGYAFAYDQVGRIAEIDSFADGLTTYNYDPTAQLIGADHAAQTDESYTYDDNGNRISGGFVIGDNNLIVSDGTFNYEYDDEGNRTRRILIATGESTEYVWDHRNRLVQVIEKDANGDVVQTVDQTYDIFNRWIGRSVDPDGPGPLAAENTYFVYDNDQIALQFDDGDLTHRYLWGPAIDQILADELVTSTAAEGEVIWPLADHLGTVRVLAISNSSGETEIASHRTFDSFGNLLAETAAIDFLFAFTGRPHDDATGLQNNLHRWYDPAIGQWVSEDPIGFSAGDANVRRYVGNEVLKNVDPDGLMPEGHHIFPQHIFNAIEGLGDAAIKFFDKATITNNFYTTHGNETYGGVRHADYNVMLKDLWTKYVEKLKSDKVINSVSEITEEHAKDFIDHVKSQKGDIAKFLARVQHEADWMHKIGQTLGKAEAVAWGESARKIDHLDGKLVELRDELAKTQAQRDAATGATKRLDNKLKRIARDIADTEKAQNEAKEKLLGITARIRAKALELLEQVDELAKAEEMAKAKPGAEIAEAAADTTTESAEAIAKSKSAATNLTENLVEGAAKPGSKVASKLSGKAAARVLLTNAPSFIGSAYALSQGDVEGAAMDAATGFLPGFWVLEMELYFLIGPEEYERIKKLSYQERANEYMDIVRNYRAQDDGVPAGATRLVNGGWVKVGQAVWWDGCPETTIDRIEKTDKEGVVTIYTKNGQTKILSSINLINN